MSHQVCPICGTGCLIEKNAKNAVTYKDQTAEIDSFFSVCDICGVEQADAEQLRKNKRKMIAFRKNVDGLLSGAEVAKLRNQLGITQVEASQIFGGGPTAFSKYESDDVAQSASMDRLLRLSHDLHSFHQLKTIANPKTVSHVLFSSSWKAVEMSRVQITQKRQIKVIPDFESKSDGSWFNLEQCA